MSSFLKQIAEVYFHNHAQDLQQFTFVFPNKRAGLFFRKYLCQLTDKPMWSPQIMGINDFILSLSPLQSTDSTALIFELYNIYRTLNDAEESFDEFYFWGNVIISDFNDIDKYNINAEQLFQNISDLKEIDSNYEYLSEAQIAAIRTFWSNFNPVNTENKERFLQTWNILHPLYVKLREKLNSENKGYDGMIYRSIVDQIKAQKNVLQNTTYKHLVFCGFNALTTCESLLFHHLKKEQKADFYWDYTDEFINDKQNKAYQFIRQNKLLFPSKYDISNTHTMPPKHIELISVSSATGMAQEAGVVLKNLCHQTTTSKEDTALVLGDENLLMPCLYALPEEVEKINITMGYPLKNSSIYQLIHLLIDLQEKARRSNKQNTFYFKHVLNVMQHKAIKQLLNNDERKLERRIVQENYIQVNDHFFANTPLLAPLFRMCTNAHDFACYLEEMIQRIQRLNTTPQELDKEFNYHFFTHNQRLRDLIEKHLVVVELSTYGSLLRKLMDNIVVPFQGEPLNGLQLLGVLETRNIDFKNIIITSMNEGTFPKHSQHPSFIPYNLRKGFELPTPELQDSIFSYYFHRLISRAENIWILYDSRTEGLNSGEASRYCHLLKYEYAPLFPNQIMLHERNISKRPELRTHTPVFIPKTPQVLALLNEYKPQGTRSLSASAINAHIDCSMRFYLRYLKNIRKPNEVQEDIDPALLGNVFHKSMEELYKPFETKEVTSAILKDLTKNKVHIKQVVEETFARHIHPNSKKKYDIRGRDYIILNIIEKYIHKTLHFDQQHTPFTYLEGERQRTQILAINENLSISVKAIIDRLDRKNNSIRIIDYKTGSENLAAKNIADLFNANQLNRSKGVFQTLFYSLILQLEGKYTNLQPNIYSIKDLFDSHFDSRIIVENAVIDNFETLKDNYETALKEHLEILFNPNIPFQQTDQNTNCTYCDFKKLCNR